jgi:transposase
MRLTDTDIIAVKDLLIQGISLDEIAARWSVSLRTVQRWSRYYKVFGTPYTPRSVVQGRPKLLTDAQADVSESKVLHCVRPRLIVLGPPTVC